MRFSFFRNIVLGLAEIGFVDILYNAMENLLKVIYETHGVPFYHERAIDGSD